MVSLFSPFKMTDTLQKEIEEAQEKLRSIDGNISALNGRLPLVYSFEVININE